MDLKHIPMKWNNQSTCTQSQGSTVVLDQFCSRKMNCFRLSSFLLVIEDRFILMRLVNKGSISYYLN